MTLPKLKLGSSLTFVSALILVVGLSIAIVSLRQQQQGSTRASYSRPDVPSSVMSERNTQSGSSGQTCFQASGDRAGAMCKADGGGSALGSAPSQATIDQVCPGGFYPSNTRPTRAADWYCGGGNDRRCCKNAAPDQVTATVDHATITLPTNNIVLDGGAQDRDSESWRNTLSYKWTKDSGPGSPALPDESGIARAEVSGLQKGNYVFKLTVTDGFASQSKTVSVTVNDAPVSQNTKLNLDLMLHGIGKAGDSVTPGEAGGGNMNPNTKLRQVTVQLLDAQGNVKFTGTGFVNFQPTGNFTGKIDMGNTVTTGSYVVKVKFAQSLNTAAPGFYTVTAGAETNIPQFSLVTGDINNDGAAAVALDYEILRGCYSYFLPPVDCDDTRKAKADLDDDGHVNQSDLNLFIRELSHVQ